MRVHARLATLAVITLGSLNAAAQQLDRYQTRRLPAAVAGLRLDALAQLRGVNPAIDRSLLAADGPQHVIVRLRGPAVGDLGDTRARSKTEVDAEQRAFLDRVRALGTDLRVIARTQLVLNAVFVEIDAARMVTASRPMPSISSTCRWVPITVHRSTTTCRSRSITPRHSAC